MSERMFPFLGYLLEFEKNYSTKTTLIPKALWRGPIWNCSDISALVITLIFGFKSK
jgi:hypothetical protein